MNARNPNAIDGLRALIFDTGGTVFDWHTSVVRSLSKFGSARGVDADWPALAKTWRRRSTAMVDVGMPMRDGRVTMDMDEVLRNTLDVTLDEHSTFGFSTGDRDGLVLGWRAMKAWPDVPVGLGRLRSRFIVAPFTILKTATVIESSRLSGLSWDAVISCEMIGIYKTNRPSYEAAAHWLDVPHSQIMMVTTHNNDLDAAHSYGFPTAFVSRPDEWGDIPSLDPDPSENADVVATDFGDLADQLGVIATA